jgi:hypothetical protein
VRLLKLNVEGKPEIDKKERQLQCTSNFIPFETPTVQWHQATFLRAFTF